MTRAEPPSLHRSRIVGAGLVTPLGIGVETNFRHMCGGHTGFVPAEVVKVGEPGQVFGAVVDLESAVPTRRRREWRRLDRANQLARVASIEALASAGFEFQSGGSLKGLLRPERIGLCVGTSNGPSASLESAIGAFEVGGRRALFRADPLIGFSGSPTYIAASLARELGIGGPSVTVNAECATGNSVIGVANGMIFSGMADGVLCVGVDAPLTPFCVASMNNLGALAPDICRPFDQQRDGFVMSEGAGAMLIVGEDVACSDGINLGTITGIGLTTDLAHPTAPSQDAEPLERAIRIAISAAGIRPDQIQLVSSHGTGTKLNDPTEVLALQTVLGSHAKECLVQAIKSMIGHSLGAAAIIEAVILGCSMREGVCPPIVHCDDPLPTELFLVRNQAREMASLNTGISISCGFGGSTTCVVIEK